MSRNEVKGKELHASVLNDNITHLLSILDDDANVNWANPDDEGRTALHVAAQHGFAVAAALLIGKGASVHIRDQNGRTALHAALEGGDDKCVALLVDKTLAALDDAKRSLRIRQMVVKEAEKQLSGAVLSRITAMVEADSRDSAAYQNNMESEEENLLRLEGLRPDGKKIPTATSTKEDVISRYEEAIRHYPRKSLVSELMTISHFRTIYNMFVAVLIVAGLNVTFINVTETGNILDFTLLTWAFGRFHQAFAFWVLMYSSTYTVLILFQLQESGAISNHLNKLLYGVYIVSLLVVPGVYCHWMQFPSATALFVLCEMARLSMKVHSFHRVNLQLAEKKNGKRVIESIYPNNLSASNFTYYMFVPTLVYETKYPKKGKRRLDRAVIYFAQTAMAIIYTYAIFQCYCSPVFPELVGTWDKVLLATFKLMLPATTVFLLAFYGVLHCWLNAFAEMTQFADRQFYLDWWNATTWSAYYRKWNITVHKFLFRHVYIECKEAKMSDNLAMWITFVFSAIIHEYIITVAFGFFAPVMFIMFLGPGVGFTYLTRLGPLRRMSKHRIWNVFMWAMLIIGNGTMMALYGRAWYQAYPIPTTN